MTFEELYKTVVLECSALPIEEIESGLRQFSTIRKSEMATTARLLAAGRKLMPKEQWKEWAMANSGLTRSECYHRAKAGDLLIAFQDKKVLYRKLLQLSGDKLLALAQLPQDVVEGFLTVTDVWNMKIAEVRIEVKCERCRIDKRALGQEPDCEHCPFHQMKEGKAAAGFSDALEIIWNMDPEAFMTGVTDDVSATKCAGNGVNLLAAALEYEKGKMRGKPDSTVNTANLLQIKAALLDGIRDIEMLIAGKIDKESNDEISQSHTERKCILEEYESSTENQCGNHTISGESNSAARSGAESDTENQCGNHTSEHCGSQCGNHTANECGNHTRNDEQTVCHSEPKEDYRICGFTGARQSGSQGTNEVSAIYQGTQKTRTVNSGSASGHEGRVGSSDGIPDSPVQRTTWEEPIDLSELSELDAPDPGVSGPQRQRWR